MNMMKISLLLLCAMMSYCSFAALKNGVDNIDGYEYSYCIDESGIRWYYDIDLKKGLVSVEKFYFDPEFPYEAAIPVSTKGAITIPLSFEGQSVTRVAPGAFMKCSGITSVIIPRSVTELGMRAFENCTSLERIEVPANVKIIDEEAFNGCAGLKEVVLHEGVEKISFAAFGGCTSLKRIVIPKGVRKIMNSAFLDCSNLQEIVLSDGLIEIDNKAFKGCTSLKRAVIPSTVMKIYDDAFGGCVELREVVICGKSTVFSWPAFVGCTSLENVHVPEGVVIHDSENASIIVGSNKIKVVSGRNVSIMLILSLCTMVVLGVLIILRIRRAFRLSAMNRNIKHCGH